jgi:hypothetical protein
VPALTALTARNPVASWSKAVFWPDFFAPDSTLEKLRIRRQGGGMRVIARSIWRTLLPFALSLLFAPVLPSLLAALETFASNEGGYAINFPTPPVESVQEFGNNRLIAHVARNGGAIYIAANGDFAEAIKPDVEMNANIENYAREINARVTSRAEVTIPRGDRTLTGIQFSYDGAAQDGKGIVVVDGTSSYLVAAGSIKPADEALAVNAFLNSFRLMPKH